MKDKMEFHEKRKESRLDCLKDGDFILLVGEGDFSFAAFLVQHTKAQVVATTLLPVPHILTERQKNNISLIETFGGSVYTDVDACHLVSHIQVNRNAYKVIIFNFPHIPGKMKISANRDLLRNFFTSAKKVLASEGEVHVTLCKGQGGTAAEVCRREWQNTWQITSMAAISDFVLDHVKPFHAEDYPSYTCSGYRGREGSFHVDGALTHVFKVGHPIVKTTEIVFSGQWRNNTTDKHLHLVSSYIETCEKYMSLFETCEHPVAKTLLSIINEIRKCSSTNVQVISFPELLVCPGKNCIRHWLKSFSAVKGLPCSVSSLLSSGKCVFEDVEQQLSKGADVITISSHVCCPENLIAAELPLCCSALFLAKSMSKVINEIYVVLNRFLCKQSSSDAVNDDNIHTVELPQDFYSQLSTVTESRLLKSTPDNEDLADFNHLQIENNIKFEEIGTIFVSYDILQTSSHALHQDVCITISDRNLKSLKDKGNCREVLNIGNVYAVKYNENIMFCTSLAIECVSMLKFHIFNHQILLSDMAYFTSHVHDGESHVIFRSPSLFPPSYVHDTSFWVSEEFEENELILLVKNMVGDLICDVRLVDTYYDKLLQKKSCCYRFTYQSCDSPLSKDKARDIHTNLVRCAIEQYLSVKLR